MRLFTANFLTKNCFVAVILFNVLFFSLRGLVIANDNDLRSIDFTSIREKLDERKSLGKGPDTLNILIVKVELGGGHKSALSALKELLTANLNQEDAKRIRFLEMDMFGDSPGNEAYFTRRFNQLLVQEEGEIIESENWKKDEVIDKKLNSEMGHIFIHHRIDIAMIEAARKYNVSNTEELRPDIVISAQPFGLKGLGDVALRKYGAPLRILPTDFEMGDWFTGFYSVASDSQNVRWIAPYDEDYLNRQFNKRQIEAVDYLGPALRPEFLKFREEINSPDKSISDAAKNEVYGVISKLTKDSFNHKTDRTLLYMMGSRGSSQNRLESYLEGIFKKPPIKSNGKLHLFLAGALESDGPNLGLDFYLQILRSRYKERSNIRVHLFGRMTAKEITPLMWFGVTLAKGGGQTALELSAVGGRALINGRVSAFAHWEKGNVDFLEDKGLAMMLPLKEEEEIEAIGGMLEEMYCRKVEAVDGKDDIVSINYQENIFGAIVKKIKEEKEAPNREDDKATGWSQSNSAFLRIEPDLGVKTPYEERLARPRRRANSF